MATMDVVSHYGGKPANFLDIGGGATHDKILESIRILNDDEKVCAIFVNIFGGIIHCDLLAYSVIKA